MLFTIYTLTVTVYNPNAATKKKKINFQINDGKAENHTYDEILCQQLLLKHFYP